MNFILNKEFQNEIKSHKRQLMKHFLEIIETEIINLVATSCNLLYIKSFFNLYSILITTRSFL